MTTFQTPIDDHDRAETRPPSAPSPEVVRERNVAVPNSVTLPAGRVISLGDRGSCFVRHAEGPPGAPTVVLLHGWAATADLNWFRSYDALSTQFNVMAMDLRGHGRGIHDGRRFRIQDCADDVAALLSATGTKSAVIVGYSMGGPVAQQTWRRHPEVVSGLVLCATAISFRASLRERLMFAAIKPTAMLAKLVPSSMRNSAALKIMLTKDDRELRQWALAEMTGHDWMRVLEAGREIGAYDSSSWISGVDVPTAQLMTVNDDIISLDRQETLSEALPNGTLHLIRGGHAVCIEDPAEFVPTLTLAITGVAEAGS